jgi:hypothetical protein
VSILTDVTSPPIEQADESRELAENHRAYEKTCFSWLRTPETLTHS